MNTELMKKILFTLLIGAGLLSGLSSCKGFLDNEPTDAVVAESALKTLDDAKVAINGIYTPLKYYTAYGRYFPQMGDSRADNLYPQVPSSGDATIYKLQYDAFQGTYFDLWYQYYNALMRANTVIQNLDALEPKNSAEEATKADLMGQALAVRAFCHFDIARLYGYPYMKDNGASLGAVVLTEPVAPAAAKLPRNTVAETYAQVITDLKDAMTLLSKSKNTGHFNYWAAELLLARAYLYKGDFSNAFTAAEDVINNSPYSLCEKSDYLEYWGKEGQPETVLELYITSDGDIDPDGGFYGIYHYLWFGDPAAGGYVIPTRSWRNLFAATPNDIRAQLIQYDDPNGSGKKTGEYWLAKFIGNKDRGYSFRRNNPRILRISEAYLISAEAGLECGQAVQASKRLNEIRVKRDPSAADVTATLDLVQIERRKEFIGEGHRFFDVLRRGGTITRDDTDPHEVSGITSIDWNDYRCVLPISHTERVLYQELQQNPGYKE